jgi:hypothetical protein
MHIAPDHLAAIADKLTPAQRRAVLAGGPRVGRGYWPLRAAMRQLGLLDPAFSSNTLSPLGRALRAHLQKETGR